MIDSGAFKGASEIEALKSSTVEQLVKYVKLARSYGYAADYRTDVGTDVVDVATNLCRNIVQEFPKSSVFTGQLVFRHEHHFQRILHNETAFSIQRRLQWNGITTVILPVRVNLWFQIQIKVNIHWCLVIAELDRLSILRLPLKIGMVSGHCQTSGGRGGTGIMIARNEDELHYRSCRQTGC